MKEKLWSYGYYDYVATASQIKRNLPEGWWAITDKIFEILPKNARIGEVKEKYGTLRFSVYNVPQEVQDVVDEVERESSYTCAFCGKQPAKAEWSGGWIVTLCEDCGVKHEDTMESNI